MLVGNGLMANLFKDYENNHDVLVFASGVSNSNETDQKAFSREQNVLEQALIKNPNKILVYFSTCSIYDASSKYKAYVNHKLSMERYIKSNASKYLIFRVSNVYGYTGNKNTIINYLINSIDKNKIIELWQNAQRNIIGAHDVKYIVKSVIEKYTTNKIINVAVRQSLDIAEILKHIELFLGKKAKIKSVNKGTKIEIDVTEISTYLDIIERKHGKGITYFNTLLKTYYRCD